MRKLRLLYTDRTTELQVDDPVFLACILDTDYIPFNPSAAFAQKALACVVGYNSSFVALSYKFLSNVVHIHLNITVPPLLLSQMFIH